MLRTWTLSLLLILLGFSASASHMSGGEIYWECIGPNQYRITMKIYRDCFGIAVDPAYTLQVQSPCGNTTLVVTTNGGTEVSQLCDLELPNSTCNGGTLPGIQEYIYTGVITLPPCNSWTISYTNIYRNAAIVNLQNPAAQRTYIRAVMNTAAAPCNDSPQFTNTAIPYVCLGQQYTYSFGVFDPEADSVSYQLISAMGLNGAPLLYVPPNTGATPIPGLTINPQTGLVTFTLNQQGNWVVNVQVNHYVNGVLTGSVMRDMQFIAYPCPNNPPDPTTGIVGNTTGVATQTGPREIRVCESGSFCFDFSISDPDPSNILEAFSNVQQNLPGATFSYTGTNPITCTVCWTAAQGTQGFFPFIVNVNDGACPIYAFQTYVYSVQVMPGLFGEVTAVDADCTGNGSLTADVTEGTAPYTYLWSNGSTEPTISAPAGTYSVVINDGAGCISLPIEGTIGTTSENATANAGPDQTACAGGGPIQLNGSVTNALNGVWSGGTGTFTGTGLNPTYTPSPADLTNGSVQLTLTTTDSGPCPSGSDVMTITFGNSFSSATISSTNALCNGTATGTATASVSGGTMSYLWNDPMAQTTATATGLAAGDYFVQVTDGQGCDTTLAISVGEPSSVIILDMNGNAEACAGDNTGSASVEVTGGTPPYNFLWSTGAQTQTIQVTSGVFSVVVTDDNGCGSSPGQINLVGGDPPPVADAGPDFQACGFGGPIPLSGTVQNALEGTWSGGSGSFAGSGVNVSYTPTTAEVLNGSVNLILTATSSGACPPHVDNVTITLTNSFAGASVSGTNIPCYGTATGTATVNVPGTGFTYAWNDPASESSATANGLSAGMYSVTVTDGTGCDTTLTVTIDEAPELSIASISGNPEGCVGDGTGSAVVVAAGGTAPYSYLWNTGDQSDAITATAGTYSVSVSDANGCAPVNAQVIIAPGGAPNQADAGPDQVSCDPTLPVQLSGTVQNATGGIWTGGSGTFNGNGPQSSYTPGASDIQNGGVTLTLTTTGNGSCPPGSDAVYIAIPNSFASVSATSTDALCNGTSSGNATVSNASPGTSFLWNDPLAQTEPTASGLAAGSYQVQLTDGSGCETTLNVTIGEPAAITIASITGVDEGCAGNGDGSATVLATGGTMPYTYLWNTGDQTPSIQVPSGTYNVTVSDANGCAPATAQITVVSNGLPNMADAGPDLVGCLNAGPIDVQGSVQNATGGSWSGGSGTVLGSGTTIQYMPSMAEILAGGADLVLTTTGNSACPPASDTVHIALSNVFLTSNLTATNATCSGQNNGMISYTPAMPGLSYQWNDPMAQMGAVATSLPPGTWTVVVTDPLGCDTTLSAAITEPTPLAVVSVTSTDVTCAGGNNGTVSLVVSGGTPAYTVAWSNGQNGMNLGNVPAGNYNAVVTDAQGCTVPAIATVQQPDPIYLAAQVPDTVCVNAPVTMTAQASGGTGGYQFNWGALGTGSTVQTSFTASQQVTVSVVDQAGCSGPNVTLPVTVLDLNSASLVTYGDTLLCSGGSALVGALLNGYPGSYTITWPGLGMSGSGPFLVPITEDRILQVNVTDNCGNMISGQVSLQLDEPIAVQLPPIIAQGCAPLTVTLPTLQLPPNSISQWNLGNGTTSYATAPTITYGAGTYTVGLTVTTANGCVNTIGGAGQIIAYSAPTVDFTASPWVTDLDNAQISFDAEPNSFASYVWAFGDGGTGNTADPLYTYGDWGTFDVQLWATDANGCIASASHPVVITPVYDINLPNAFSPNANGGNGGTWDPNALDNDIFYPFIRFVDEFRMRVFNRWGELIFESDDIRIGWDGYYRGQLSPQDVYVVQTWVKFLDGKEVQKLSDLTLFR